MTSTVSSVRWSAPRPRPIRDPSAPSASSLVAPAWEARALGLKDRLRDRPVIGTMLAVQDRYNADAAGQFAAAIAYYGFLSLFPLILLALSLTGFFLASDPDAQADAFDLLTSSLPGLEAQLDDTVTAIVEARAATGIVGVLLLTFSGLRVVDSATVATSRIFRVDVTAVSGLKRRLRGFGALALLGTLALAGAAAGSLVGVRTGGVTQLAVSVGGTLLSLSIDFVLFLIAYRLLTAAAGPAWGDLWPGALLGAVGWTALKVAGSTLVANQVAGAQQVYGGLASIIGILFLLFLAARLYLYGAEWNAVRHDADAVGDGPPGDATHASDSPPRADRSRVRPEPDATAAIPKGPPAGVAANDAGRPHADEDDGPWASLRPALAFLLAAAALAAVARVFGLRPPPPPPPHRRT